MSATGSSSSRIDSLRSYYELEGRCVKLDIRDLRRETLSASRWLQRGKSSRTSSIEEPDGCELAHARRLSCSQGSPATDTEIGQCLGYQGAQIQNAALRLALRAQYVCVVRRLHDPDSRLLGGPIQALRAGLTWLWIISLLSSAAGRMISG